MGLLIVPALTYGVLGVDDHLAGATDFGDVVHVVADEGGLVVEVRVSEVRGAQVIQGQGLDGEGVLHHKLLSYAAQEPACEIQFQQANVLQHK